MGCSRIVKSKKTVPDRVSHFESYNSAVIPYGGGYSYNDIFFHKNSTSISSNKFNRILDFNNTKKIIEVESGATLNDIFYFLQAEGFYLKIQPGFPLITIGGCIAGNVHGKNQYKDGNFIKIIKSIKIYNPDLGLIEISRNKNKKLFDLTVGGFGLSGFIISAKIKIDILPSNFVRNKKIYFNSLLEAFDILKKESKNNDFLYSWHQPTIASDFRGFVNVGNFQNSNKKYKPKKITPDQIKKKLPFYSVYSQYVVFILSKIYFYKNYIFKNITTNVYDSFFPLAKKGMYFYLYGKEGLIETQFIIPEKRKLDFYRFLLNQFELIKPNIVLFSVKYFKKYEPKYLRFDDDGYCVSFNFLRTDSSKLFLKDLYSFLRQYNCKINLTKDSSFEMKYLNKHFPNVSYFFSSIGFFKKTAKQYISKINIDYEK